MPKQSDVTEMLAVTEMEFGVLYIYFLWWIFPFPLAVSLFRTRLVSILKPYQLHGKQLSLKLLHPAGVRVKDLKNRFSLLFSKTLLNCVWWFPSKCLLRTCTFFCWSQSTLESFKRLQILTITQLSITPVNSLFSLSFIQLHKRTVGEKR